MYSPFGENHEEFVKELTLALIYMTHWDENLHGERVMRSWKGYDFDILDKLRDDGLLDYSNQAKSVYLTEEGATAAIQAAEFFLQSTLKRNQEFAMPAPTPTTRQGSEPTTHQIEALILRLEFKYLGNQECWRVIRVPAQRTFYDLHFIIQTLGDWLDYHIYEFQRRGEAPLLIAPIQEDHEGFWTQVAEEDHFELLDMEETPLGNVFTSDMPIVYSYDYGCGWEINITCEKNEPTSSDDIICFDGAGDWPPDDGNFERAEHFDLERVNKRLKRWKTMQRKHNANREKQLK